MRGRRRLTSSKPSRQTTLAGTLRTGAMPVIVTRPVRRRRRPRRSSDDAVDDGADVVERQRRAELVAPATTAERRTSSIASSTSAICHARRRGAAHSRSTISTRTSHQLVDRPLAAARRRSVAQAGDELGEPSGAGDVVATDVVEGHDAAEARRAASGAGMAMPRSSDCSGAPRCRASMSASSHAAAVVAVEAPTSCRGAGSTLANRSRSSTVMPRRRRTGSSAAMASTSMAVQRPATVCRIVASAAADRVLGAERQVADGDRDRQRAAAEHGRGERLEAGEVGADDQHVVGPQRRVGDEQVAEHVAQHLELADRPVAGVDLDACVGGRAGERRRRAVGERGRSGGAPAAWTAR